MRWCFLCIGLAAIAIACESGSDQGDEDDGGGASGGSGLGLGEPCTDGAECASGACADGICCDTACDGPCRACSAEGTCTVHALGQAPEAGCEAGICDGSGTCASGQLKWARLFPGEENDGGSHIAIMPDDGTIVNGTHHGTVNFGGAEFPDYHPDDAGIFQLKLDPAGNHLWSSSEMTATAITTGMYAYDADGRGYVAGALSVGGQTGPIGLLDDEGKLASLLVSGTQAVAWALAVDAAGNVAISTIGGTLCGQSGMVIAKLAPDGSCTWSHAVTGQTWYVPDLAFDSAGALVVAAAGVSPLDFGGGSVTGGQGGLSTQDFFIAKYDADGNHVWSIGFPGTNHYRAMTGIGTAGENVLIAGEFDGTLELGGAMFFSPPMRHVAFVAALDTNGQHLWSKQLGDTSGYADAMEVDRSGNVILGGYWEGTLDVGAGPMVTTGTQRGFLAKLTPAGQHLWSKDLGEETLSAFGGIVTAPDGQLALTGGVWGITLDGMTLTTSGKRDVLVARLSP